MSQKTIVNLFRMWTVTGIVCFCLMLLHESRPASVLGRYSASYSLSLIIVLITIAVAIAGWILAERQQIERLIIPSRAIIRLLSLSCLIFIFLFWLFMPGATFLPAIAVFRIYIVLIASGLSLFYLYQTEDAQQLINPRIWQFLLIAGTGLAVILTVSYIGKVPASLYFDEPLTANFGWTCVQDGSPGVMMLPPRNTSYMDVTLPIAYCIPGLLMKWFGTNLSVARSFGIICLWIAAPFVYFTAKRLYGSASAVIAGLIMMLFALSHNHLRSDPYVTLVLAIALYGYFRAEEKPGLWQHFMVGFALATVIEGHQLGVRFIPIFVLLYLWQYLRVVRQEKRWIYAPFIVFALGGLSYLPIYYYLHVVLWAKTDLPGAIALLQAGYGEQLTVGGNVGFWQRISDNLQHWFTLYPVRQPLEVLLLFTGLVSAAWRRESSDRLLLFLFTLSFILYIYIAPKPTVYYWVHHLPLIALMTAAFVHSIIRDKKDTRLFAIFPVLLVMVFYSAHILLAAQGTQNADRLMEISFDINEAVPPEVDIITGHQVYFYGLSGRRFYDSNTYSKWTVPEANDRFGIESPQAVIRSVGLDEHPTVRAYMEETGMIAVRCYPTDFFGGRTILYILPEFADEVEAEGC